jgi:hypothetical protein
MGDQNQRQIWIRWVWVNAWAELLGLGATFLLGYGLFAYLGEPQTPLSVLGFMLLMTSTGIVEGTIVGWFQWRIIRDLFEKISFKSWWLATLIGALTAWFLGSLPSSLMGMGAEEVGSTPIEPPLALVLLLACGMGLVLGIILGLPQWRVLREHVNRAWIWLPANSLAWGAGMALIFAGIDLAQRGIPITVALLIMVLTLFVTGATVGAIHGLFLVRLAGISRILEISDE